MGGNHSDWCVLRTASRHTIQLAESLTADGYEAWTPVETKLVNVPNKPDKRELKLPIMPSYVFARSQRIVDLLLLEDMPVKPSKGGAHADFTVMRPFGEIALVPDVHLTALRHMEAKLTPKPKTEKQYVQAFATGDKVRMGSGIFCGLVGTVERSDGAHTLLTFGTRSVKINTLHLRRDGVCAPDTAVFRDAA